MPIHSIIHEKRKELGLTQEQIADYLGVSAPAVNKWEKGANYPDISLLPALARLFKIDMNTLLCFNDGLSKQEIDHFTLELSDTIKGSGFAQGFALGIGKVREYPSCGPLIHTTALMLDGALIMSDLSLAEKQSYTEQITALYERAFQTADGDIRHRAAFMLSSKYMQDGNYDKAQEFLDTLPDQGIDKRQLQARLYIEKGQLDKAAQLLERKLMMQLNDIQSLLMHLADIALKESKPELAAYIAETYESAARLFGLWDYNAYTVSFNVALSQKDVPGSLRLMKSMLESIEAPWQAYDSPLYHHAVTERSQDSLNQQQALILPPLLSAFETDPQFEFLRDNEEFSRLIRKYRAKC